MKFTTTKNPTNRGHLGQADFVEKRMAKFLRNNYHKKFIGMVYTLPVRLRNK